MDERPICCHYECGPSGCSGDEYVQRLRAWRAGSLPSVMADRPPVRRMVWVPRLALRSRFKKMLEATR